MSFQLQVTWSPLFEMYSSFNAYRKGTYTRNIDQGTQWVKEVKQQLAPAFDAELAEAKLLECSDFFLLLLVMHGGDGDFDTFIDWVEALSPGELYEQVAPYLQEGVPSDLRELRDQYAGFMRKWKAQYFDHFDPQMLAVLEQEAARWTEEVQKGQEAPEAFAERKTHGVYFEPPEEPTRLLIVPTYHYRPLTVMHDYQNLLVVMAPVDKPSTDPLQPSPQMMRVLRALADENRLKMLRFLRAEARTFTEVVQESGLTKGTVNHHLYVLRCAGLVRLRTYHPTRPVLYELRQSGAEVAEILDAYLGEEREG